MRSRIKAHIVKRDKLLELVADRGTIAQLAAEHTLGYTNAMITKMVIYLVDNDDIKKYKVGAKIILCLPGLEKPSTSKPTPVDEESSCIRMNKLVNSLWLSPLSKA